MRKYYKGSRNIRLFVISIRRLGKNQMKISVNLIATECKKPIANNESYIMQIYKSINFTRMIKSLNLVTDGDAFSVKLLRFGKQSNF